jgi:hypothetical protein
MVCRIGGGEILPHYFYTTLEKPMKLMKFNVDAFYTDLENPLYLKGQVYKIEDNMVARWLKRGAEIVEEVAVVPEPKKEVVEEEESPVVEVESSSKKVSKRSSK